MFLMIYYFKEKSEEKIQLLEDDTFEIKQNIKKLLI
jgi:hypothetical protein